ncbi:class IV adenylate cyclase [Candidatus Falkowbacteria bacterium]|nr:MAG: class IV adenylate cyclase [Candidatus Falkowbacteria bacterium]
MREIEIKLKAKNFENLEKSLNDKGVLLSIPITQHDVIYSLNNSTKEFESAGEKDVIIRLRYLKDKTVLTLKKQCSRELDNLEYETEVKEPDQMHNILSILGWTPIVGVKKIRRKGKLGEYEICLDQVEKLGDFVELEKLAADDVNPEQIREELFKELETLGLSRNDEETRGYDTQMYQLGLTLLSSPI